MQLRVRRAGGYRLLLGGRHNWLGLDGVLGLRIHVVLSVGSALRAASCRRDRLGIGRWLALHGSEDDGSLMRASLDRRRASDPWRGLDAKISTVRHAAESLVPPSSAG